MEKVAYQKPWLKIEDQILKLERRGLSIPDKEAAARFLKYMNYYCDLCVLCGGK